MGSLGRIVAGERPPDWDDYWYAEAGITSFAGTKVTARTAMQVGAVWRCVNLLASTIAALPLPVYRRLENGGKARASNHPLADVLEWRPNTWQTGFGFKEMLMGHVLLRGNFYAEILSGPRGPVDQLRPVHPDRVTKIDQIADGTLRYHVRDVNGASERIVLGEDMFHLMGFSEDGISGLSILTMARESFGLGIAFDRYASSLFRRGMRPSGVLKHPEKLTPNARANLRAALEELHSGAENGGRPLLLDEKMEWQQIGLTNKDAEFLDSRKFAITEIARWFGVPPHKIADLERSTNNNIEHQGIEWVVDGILPWAKRIEQTITRDLIVAPEVYFAEFLLEGLLRGDTKSRYEAYALARQWGWLSVNDIRRLENMNPVEGGDTYLEPLNMVPAGGDRAASGGLVLRHVGGGRVPQLTGPAPGTAVTGQLRLLASDAAARVVRKELSAMRRLAEKTGDDQAAWHAGVTAFYADHGRFVAETMRIPEHQGVQYAHDQRDELLARGPVAMETWETDRVATLADMATHIEELAA